MPTALGMVARWQTTPAWLTAGEEALEARHMMAMALGLVARAEEEWRRGRGEWLGAVLWRPWRTRIGVSDRARESTGRSGRASGRG
jgi:hypothetical protein